MKSALRSWGPVIGLVLIVTVLIIVFLRPGWYEIPLKGWSGRGQVITVASEPYDGVNCPAKAKVVAETEDAVTLAAYVFGTAYLEIGAVWCYIDLTLKQPVGDRQVVDTHGNPIPNRLGP